jgi:hypothetical protein
MEETNNYEKEIGSFNVDAYDVVRSCGVRRHRRRHTVIISFGKFNISRGNGL